MDPRTHWETIYRTKDVHEVSWFQSEARRSRDLITRICPDRSAPIIDVGAGASVLVDNLLAAGYQDLSVLDWSDSALKISRDRLGADSSRAKWMRADVLRSQLDEGAYSVWHDRAVFHFLTGAADRKAYVDQVRRAVKPGGYVLVATYAEDGPEFCSGLPVVRYSAEGLHSEFGTGFELIRSEHENHRTPGGAEQSFCYCVCRRDPQPRASAASSEKEMSISSEDLRIYVYDHLAASGLPPTLAAIATHFGTTRAVARQELAALKIGKTILVRPESGEIWMAGPFSAVKTDYGAIAGDRTWWANCAWDMLGIPMVLNAPVQVHTKCTDCGSPMAIDCSPSHPPTVNAVVHFLMPARRWYEDIAFT